VKVCYYHCCSCIGIVIIIIISIVVVLIVVIVIVVIIVLIKKNFLSYGFLDIPSHSVTNDAIFVIFVK
jgi:hypothetical protein